MSKIRMLKKEAQVALPNSGETYIAEDGTVSMVMDDHHDDTYEPSEQEIKEYAEWLGMSLPEDNELLWIAREGLKAPLPKEWKPCKTDSGEVYYFNFKTGDSIWDHPMDEHFKNKLKQEKERLRKAKEGAVVHDPLAKLPSRNSIVFTEQGVVKHEGPITPTASSSTTASAGVKTPTHSQEERAIEQRRAAPAALSSASVGAAAAAATKSTPTSTPVKRDEAGSSNALPTAAGKMFSTSLTSTPAAAAASSAPPAAASSSAAVSNAHDDIPESPRLVSEAEKMLQDRVRQETEAEHKRLVADLEQKLTQQSAALRKAHDDELAELKRQSQLHRRNQIGKIEDRLHDDLEQQQRNIDQRCKREIKAQEDEIERLRDRLREIQTSANARLEREIADMEQRTADALRTKVRDVESEIASIRMRHAKAQMDLIEQENQKLELDLNRASIDVKEKVSVDYEAKAAQLRAQHAETIERLRSEAKRAMEEETQRAAQTRGGNQDTAIAELRERQVRDVAQVQQEGAAQVAALRSGEEEKRAAYLLQRESEIALVLRQSVAASSSSSAELQAQLAAIDADTEARLREVHDRMFAARAQWRSAAEILRAQQLAQAETARSGADNATAEASALQAEISEALRQLNTETSSILSDVRRRHQDAEEALQRQLEREAQLVADGSRQAAATAAVNADLDAFRAAQTKKRLRDEREFQRSKELAEEAHRKSIAEYEAQVSAARGAPPKVTTTVATIPASAASVRAAALSAIQNAVRSAQAKVDSSVQESCRRAREEAATLHSQRMLRLADELANEEQRQRRVVDEELTRTTHNADAAHRTSSSAAAESSSGVLLQDHERNMSEVRLEFAEREREVQREYEERIAVSSQQLNTTRSTIATLRRSLAALQHQPQRAAPTPDGVAPGPGSSLDAGGMPSRLPPRSQTPTQRHPSPGPAAGGLPADVLQYVQEQRRVIASRQELLQTTEHHANDPSSSSGRGHHEALEKYYATIQDQRRAASSHADPSAAAEVPASPAVSAQIVVALHRLNEKLESLAQRVDGIATATSTQTASRQPGGAAPGAGEDHKAEGGRHRRSHHHHHHHRAEDEDGAKKRRSSSTDLAAKWGTILRDVSSKSKSSKIPNYDAALRRYLDAE